MSLSECNIETNIISNLADKPAITPEQLKKSFDRAPTELKKYINETLLPEVEELINSKVAIAKDSRLITKTEIEKLAGIQEGATKVIITSGTAEPTEEIEADYYVQYFE